MDSDALEARIFDLIGYMATSGRNLLDETPLYGPFRLVDAASRLIHILKEAGIASSRLSIIQERIDEGKYSVMADTKQFSGFLDSVVDTIVDHMDGDAGEGGGSLHTDV